MNDYMFYAVKGFITKTKYTSVQLPTDLFHPSSYFIIFLCWQPAKSTYTLSNEKLVALIMLILITLLFEYLSLHLTYLIQ